MNLVTRIKPESQEPPGFWNGFVDKCASAWDVFFPSSQVGAPRVADGR